MIIYLPIWLWVRQLGWWPSQLFLESRKIPWFQSTHQNTVTCLFYHHFLCGLFSITETSGKIMASPNAVNSSAIWGWFPLLNPIARIQMVRSKNRIVSSFWNRIAKLVLHIPILSKMIIVFLGIWIRFLFPLCLGYDNLWDNPIILWINLWDILLTVMARNTSYKY